MAETDTVLTAVDATTGECFGSPIPVDGPDEVAAACAAAEAAFDPFRHAAPELRARLLEGIAEHLQALGETLIATAARESGLPRARIEGELGRTLGQLRMFAEVARRAEWRHERHDPALPDRTPLPRPDLRLGRIPLGPVAVFGASNFPLAFSTAGGDTASALAVGCPVVVKANPAHPLTAQLAALAVHRAVADVGLPQGVFAQVQGAALGLGEALVRDPRIAAVGFTGSRRGGLAILRLAQARPVPIPVYAEMSSINPVLLLPAALAQRAAAIGAGYAQSLLLGAGQFCTNPGLVLALESDGLDTFVAAAASAVAAAAPQVMLTRAIHAAYEHQSGSLEQQPGLDLLAAGPTDASLQSGNGRLFRTTAATFMANPVLTEEVFGPAGLVVTCRDESELTAVLYSIEGQLTGTLHMAPEDTSLAGRLLPLLERKVGRIVFNGWPTGVEVCDAMVHGGPYPATSDARTTSVGSLAVERFLRPVCYQDIPPALAGLAADGWVAAGTADHQLDLLRRH